MAFILFFTISVDSLENLPGYILSLISGCCWGHIHRFCCEYFWIRIHRWGV